MPPTSAFTDAAEQNSAPRVESGNKVGQRPVDLALVLLPSASFGLFVSAHVALVYLLSARPPRFRAALAFVILPLAPFFGFREGFRTVTAVWVFSLVAYGVALSIAVGT